MDRVPNVVRVGRVATLGQVRGYVSPDGCGPFRDLDWTEDFGSLFHTTLVWSWTDEERIVSGLYVFCESYGCQGSQGKEGGGGEGHREGS